MTGRTITPPRIASPQRWQDAARRAIAEGVNVRQVNENGMWVASSGTRPDVAYVLEIAGGVVQRCSCPAAEFSDPVCKHKAAYYLQIGTLSAPAEISLLEVTEM